MTHYILGRVFKKHWYWFESPHDVPGADMVNFFSYDNYDYPGFQKKETLTAVIDVTRSLEDIWSGMREKFIRKQIEKGKRQGITVHASTNFEDFYPVYLRFRKGKQLAPERFSTLRQNGLLFLAYFDNRVIAGGVFLGDGVCMRAWVLASERLDAVSGRMRDVIGQANRMIIWEAIRFAKKKEYARFDLGGIDPQSQDPSQRSLAEFKEAFGGTRRNAYYYHKVYSKILRTWISLRNHFQFLRR